MILVTTGIVFSWNSKDFRFYSSFTFPNLRVAAMLEGTYCRFLYQSPRSIIYQQCKAKKVELGFHQGGWSEKTDLKNSECRGVGKRFPFIYIHAQTTKVSKTCLLSIYIEEKNHKKICKRKTNQKQNLTKQTHTQSKER